MLKLNKKKLLEIFWWSIGVIGFIFIIQNYFKPFTWIVGLYLIGNPINKFLKKRIRYKELCAGITLLVINIIGVVTVFYLGDALFEGIGNIINDNLSELRGFLMKVEALVKGVVGEINLIEAIKNFFKLDYITLGATSTGEGIISYFIGNICVFFIFSDKEKIKKVLEELISNKVNKRIHRIFFNLKNIVKIHALLLLISTIIITLGFKILRIENYLFVGVLCGILDILPYVGTIIVFIPIIIYNIIVKNYLIAFGLICLYLLVRIIVEILEAKLVSDKFNIHPLLSLLSIYIGVKGFGILGAIIGPIFCMTIIDIISEN